MENFTLSVIINDSKETFTTTDVPCFTFTNHLILKVLMVFAYVLVIGTSIIGNTLLAFIYFKSKKMKTTINCCIMNMVLADLLVTLVYMPRMVARILISLEWLVEGTLGLFLCVLVSLSQEISICVSILTVVLIAFEIPSRNVPITSCHLKEALHMLAVWYLAVVTSCAIPNALRRQNDSISIR